MLVIHAAWDGGRLVLWAEAAANAGGGTSRAKVRPHPFAAPAAALIEELPHWGTRRPRRRARRSAAR